MKILYVDDNLHNAYQARGQLQQADSNIEVEIATTYREAQARLMKLEEKPLDLVFTRLRLPDGDGISLSRQIGKRAVPVAIISDDAQTLHEIDLRNRAMLKAIPDLMFLFSADGHYLDLHAQDESQFVMPPHELVGRHVRDVLPEALAKEVQHSIQCVITSGQPVTLDYSLTIQGGQRYYESRLVKCNSDKVLCIVRDITDNQQTQEALQQSEARFRELAENIGAVFFISEAFESSPMGKITYVSPSYETIWGQPCETLYRNTNAWFDAVHPDDRRHVAAALKKAPIGQFNEIFRIIRPDGEIRWLHDRVYPVYNEHREVRRIVGIVEDITDRKHTEAMLRKSRELYRSVIDSQIQLICRYLPDTTLTFVNEAYCRFFNKSRHELIGNSFLTLIPEAEHEAVLQHVESLVADPRIIYVEHEVLRADGQIGWQRWVDHAVFDSQGDLVEFQGIGQDITEQKQAEDALLQRDQMLQSMFQSLSSHVCVLDSNGVITYASRSWKEFAINNGGSLNDVSLGNNYLDVIARSSDQQSAQKAWKGIRRVLAGEVPAFTLEYPCDSPTEARWFLMCVDPMPPEHGGVVISHTDITQRKLTEEALQEALDELQKLKDQLHAENVYLQEAIMVAHNFGEMIGRSSALQKVLRQAEQVAPLDTSVLIMGETGTGKELLAHAIHSVSRRKNRALVTVNCATLPTHLIESELFGHEKGAFTGAVARRMGRFEIANGGTIFLDEIGELPLDLQAKLLRVLQEGEFERLGSSHTIKVDVRAIAATNRNLQEAVNKGLFRSDLFYRLSIFPITMPPLRERKEDIPMLVTHFVKHLGAKLGKEIESIPNEVMESLQNYPWPGNIRELKNVIERAAIITQGTRLRLLDSLHYHSSEPLKQAATASRATTGDLTAGAKESESSGSLHEETLKESQRNLIIQVLEKTYWKVEGPNGGAVLLGLHPNTLRSRMKKLGITKPKFKSN